MRISEECPYITPCGFCSRQGKQCDSSRKNNPKPRHDGYNAGEIMLDDIHAKTAYVKKEG